MGTWGEGVFKNDAAGEWTDQLDRGAKSSVVANTLSQVAGQRKGHLESAHLVQSPLTLLYSRTNNERRRRCFFTDA